jgi:hypothetical protein
LVDRTSYESARADGSDDGLVPDFRRKAGKFKNS